MSEIIKPEVISRRKALSLLGLAAAFGLAVPPTVLTGSDAEAQYTTTAPGAPATAPASAPQTGTERRHKRRTARHERRHERRTGRHERREERRTGRHERREERHTTGKSPAEK
jgi:hypothetical protein